MSDKKLVHIVDDEDAIRRSVSFMLKTSGFAVQTWATGMTFLKEVRHVEQGCILLDVRMPEMDGLAVQAALSHQGITMPVIILTGHGDVSVAVRAMKGGAVDFLEKPFEKAVLLGSIEAAFERLAIAGDRTTEAAEAEVMLGILTPREKDVLEGLAQGLPNKTIAYDLGISPRTVEVHRANLMLKLNVRSLSDALRIAFAVRMGL
jgi:two-component system response regulator FixJ